MNLKKLLLIPMLFTSLSAKELLNDFQKAMDNSTTKGELSLLNDNGKLKDKAYETALIYGNLHFESSNKAALQLGLTMEALIPTYNGKQRNALGHLDPENQSVEILSEAYLKFIDDRNFLTFGRQIIDTPLLNSDSTALISQSYNGYLYEYKVNSDTFFLLGHMNQFHLNNSETFSAISAKGRAKQGISFIGSEDVQENGLSTKLYYYYSKELYDAFFLQMDKIWSFKTSKLLMGFQNINTAKNHQSKNLIANHADTHITGIRVGLKTGGFSTVILASQNSANAALNQGYGGLSHLYLNSLIGNLQHDGEYQSVGVKLHYDFRAFGWDNLDSTFLYKETKYQDNPLLNSKSNYFTLHYDKSKEGGLYFDIEGVTYENQKSDSLARARYTLKF